MRPGQTSTELRWRIGSWLVGAGLVGVAASVVFLDSVGFACFCVAAGLVGVLISNPFRSLKRLRDHLHAEPIFRLRPLGLIGFTVFLVAFLVPYAIGDWLLTMLGEQFEGSQQPDEPTTPMVEEDTLAAYDTLFTPTSRPWFRASRR